MNEAAALANINADFSADPGFSSHLPLVIIDTGGEDILPSRRWNAEEGYAVSIPGAKPYVKADIVILENGSGSNRLGDTPNFASPAQIRFSGDIYYPNPKGQYRISLLDYSGRPSEAPLLGMDSGGEWELIASVRDSSLIRDFLALTLSAELFPATPDIRFCEVFSRVNGACFYRGVYLLAESVTEGPGRIDLSAPAFALPGFLGGDDSGGYILRRGNYNPDGVTLETFTTNEGIVDSYLELVYPSENVAGAMISEIEENISKVEEVLYSDSPVVYVNYPDYVDMDSFIDYYLINEYLMNYEAGWNSAYMHKAAKGKIKAGPLWDNAGCFDNGREAADPKETFFFTTPWLNRMVRDLFFLKSLETRYSRLRRDLFADDRVIEIIDGIARWLEPASRRDWARWGYAYGGLYGQERMKIKYLLVEHAAVIGNQLRVMSWDDELMDSSYSNEKSSILAVGFVILFFLSVRIGRHH
jgi:hypothetical protein